MTLVKARSSSDNRPINYDNRIASKIQQRRYQILVHSLIYYELDVNIVSDAKWAEWGKELVALQNAHPDIADKVIFAEAFKTFDGSTGFNLPYKDEQVVNIAYRLLSGEKAENNADLLYKLQYCIRTTPAEYDSYKKKPHSVKATTPVRKEVKPVEQKQRKGLFSVPRK